MNYTPTYGIMPAEMILPLIIFAAVAWFIHVLSNGYLKFYPGSSLFQPLDYFAKSRRILAVTIATIIFGWIYQLFFI